MKNKKIKKIEDHKKENLKIIITIIGLILFQSLLKAQKNSNIVQRKG